MGTWVGERCGAFWKWIAAQKDAVTTVAAVTAALTFVCNVEHERGRWEANVTAVSMDSTVTGPSTFGGTFGGTFGAQTTVTDDGGNDAPRPPGTARGSADYTTVSLMIRNLSFRPSAIVDIAVVANGKPVNPYKYRRVAAVPRQLEPWGVLKFDLRIDHSDAGSGPFTLTLLDMDFNEITVERVPPFPAEQRERQ